MPHAAASHRNAAVLADVVLRFSHRVKHRSAVIRRCRCRHLAEGRQPPSNPNVATEVSASRVRRFHTEIIPNRFALVNKYFWGHKGETLAILTTLFCGFCAVLCRITTALHTLGALCPIFIDGGEQK